MLKHNRKTVWGATLLSALVLGTLWLGSALAETKQLLPKIISVQTTPNKTAKQGDIVLVDVMVENALPKGSYVQLGGNKSPLYWIGENKDQVIHYQGVFGLSVDEAAKATALTIKQADGTTLKDAGALTVVAKNFGRQNIGVSKTKRSLEPIAGEMEAIGALKNKKSGARYWQQGQFISPTIDCQNSPFGVRRYYNGKYSGNYHKGVDLRSPMSRPVKATAAGVVDIATTKFRLHGGTVGIDHGQGVSSIYIHLSKVAVKPGEVVKQGQVIGYVGSTGFAMGPHLHWGLYANGNPVDPNLWVPYKKCGG